MDFALSSEQRQFAASLHELLGSIDAPGAARAWAEGRHEAGIKIWQRLGDLGAVGLLVSEHFGGLGGTAVDMVVAFDALGYHCVPGPIVESAVVVPALLEGRDAERWLPSLAEAQCFATVAVPPHVPLALDADIADLVLATHDGQLMRGRVAERVPSIDPVRRLYRLDSGSLVETGDVHQAVELGTLAVAAQLAGLGRWLLDAAVAYANQRHQYGKPIGQYQAVKHLLADVVTELELARPLLYGAATTGRRQDVSAAKAIAGQAAYLAARTALQVHGAIGYTAEHDLGRYLTKVRALVGAWGTTSFHRRRVLTALTGDR